MVKTINPIVKCEDWFFQKNPKTEPIQGRGQFVGVPADVVGSRSLTACSTMFGNSVGFYEVFVFYQVWVVEFCFHYLALLNIACIICE